MSKKILVFRFYHETNAFCPAPADMAAFEKMQIRIGEEMFRAVRGTRADVGGILSVLEEEGHDFELIPVIGMGACPSGPVTGDVYQFCMDHIRRALEEKGPVDAIMIAFHGAMVAEGHPDAEGDVLETLRSWVGGEIPISPAWICTPT